MTFGTIPNAGSIILKVNTTNLFVQFRMWRKNRRPITSTVYGVDLNRNWNNNWLGKERENNLLVRMWDFLPSSLYLTNQIFFIAVAGSSVDPSSDSYAGSGPFSEPETRTLSSYIRSIGDQIDLYLSFHSFSQLLLIPFGNSTEPYANYHDAVSLCTF